MKPHISGLVDQITCFDAYCARAGLLSGVEQMESRNRFDHFNGGPRRWSNLKTYEKRTPDWECRLSGEIPLKRWFSVGFHHY